MRLINQRGRILTDAVIPLQLVGPGSKPLSTSIRIKKR